jgi:hypothetical protein
MRGYVGQVGNLRPSVTRPNSGGQASAGRRVDNPPRAASLSPWPGGPRKAMKMRFGCGLPFSAIWPGTASVSERPEVSTAPRTEAAK